MTIYLLALGAALLFGIGSVVQQRVAFDAPPGKSLRLSLLLWLVRQPMWLLGVGTAVVGNVLSGTALGLGSVALVQPLLVTRLLFAIPLSAAWMRQRLVARDWLGVLATACGLGLFVALGHPEPGQDTDPFPWRWLMAILAIVGAVAAFVALSRRVRAARAAPLLGAGAGILFGLQSGLTHTAVRHLIDGGVSGLLLTWTTYAVVVSAVLGTLLIQSAYQMAPLTASYPTLAAVEPLAGVAIGIGVLGGVIALGPLPLAGELLGLAVMTTGIFVLANSPLVTGTLPMIRERADTERAYRTEEELARELTRVERLFSHHDRAVPSQRQHDAEAIRTELEQVEVLLGRFQELHQDIQRNRSAFLAGEGRDRSRLAAHEELLGHWEDQLDDRHRRLSDRAEHLRLRVRALE